MAGKETEWFEDALLWEYFVPALFDEDRQAEIPIIIEGICTLSGLTFSGRKRLRVVDVCCGPGRISNELARLGCSVTGIDITPSFIAAAREKAPPKSVEYIPQDARSFRRLAFFDLALNLYTSFGYFSDPEDDYRMVKNVYESLVDGGIFVLEMQGKELAVRDIGGSEWVERDGSVILTEYEPCDSWNGIVNHWVCIKDGIHHDYRFVRRLYAATELRSLLLTAGFSSVYFYGDWDGSPYDGDARIMIAVAFK